MQISFTAAAELVVVVVDREIAGSAISDTIQMNTDKETSEQNSSSVHTLPANSIAGNWLVWAPMCLRVSDCRPIETLMRFQLERTERSHQAGWQTGTLH